MKKILIYLVAVLFVFILFSEATAVTIDLFDWGFNVDGDLYFPGDPLPGFFDVSGFDFSTGLGEISINLDSGAGSHFLVGFFDHEIDALFNGYTNESGSILGVPETNQSWEIDEPGYFFGDIYDNFLNGTLDNSNSVPAGFEDDVSIAMAWDYFLSTDEIATINFIISEKLPEEFSVRHFDFESQSSIFLSSEIDIKPTATPVPVPPTFILMSSVFLFFLAFKIMHIRRINS